MFYIIIKYNNTMSRIRKLREKDFGDTTTISSKGPR